MRKHVFRQLVSDLNQKHGLEPMKHVDIEEAVAIKELHIEIQKKDFNILKRQFVDNFIGRGAKSC